MTVARKILPGIFFTHSELERIGNTYLSLNMSRLIETQFELAKKVLIAMTITHDKTICDLPQFQMWKNNEAYLYKYLVALQHFMTKDYQPIKDWAIKNGIKFSSFSNFKDPRWSLNADLLKNHRGLLGILYPETFRRIYEKEYALISKSFYQYWPNSKEYEVPKKIDSEVNSGFNELLFNNNSRIAVNYPFTIFKIHNNTQNTFQDPPVRTVTETDTVANDINPEGEQEASILDNSLLLE